MIGYFLRERALLQGRTNLEVPMKFLLLALALIPSFSQAARVEGPRFVKKLDGGIAYCNQISQAGNPAYYPTNLELSALDRETLRFSAPISFVSCAQTGSDFSADSFKWVPRNPLEPVPARDLDGNAILTVTKSNEFVLISNTIRIVGVQAIVNTPDQTASFSIPLDRVITEEQKAALDRGISVNTRFTFFTRAIVSVIDVAGKEIPLGLRSGGAYTVLFTLAKGGADGLVVSNLSFQP